ncbi:Mut7-C RNAse domain-containing protein [Mycobacterium sp. E2238]|uniref:Mut7-C RNAse domain-containing protein n=1 Tax=Mycobacterium sp. E2238 TaxID=1834131 RepID=UPI000801382B|nr:Mut7-C RNAse domain-containing protein [Mycobacterium sp. E2238]OBI28342.1 hypothetical protein A5711_01985 [Mycobacterium sp. E2238]
MNEPTGDVEVRAYAELNDFLPAESRGLAVRRPFRPHQTVKDVLEAMGIPHTEVDLILVNGCPRDFAYRPSFGDRIAAHPGPRRVDDPRFVVDVNLGRLAWLLRLLGLDVWWTNDADDKTLADISGEQRRILLTRDRGLLKRRAITHGLFVRSDDPEEQALDVLRRLDLGHRLAPLTRCVRCNGTLSRVSKDEVIDQLEPLTRQHYQEFSRCAECGRIYWPGSHYAKLVRLVESLRDRLG